MVTEPLLIKAFLLSILTEKNDEIVILDSIITRINSSSKVSLFIIYLVIKYRKILIKCNVYLKKLYFTDVKI